jgi:hypothetical protein
VHERPISGSRQCGYLSNTLYGNKFDPPLYRILTGVIYSQLSGERDSGTVSVKRGKDSGTVSVKRERILVYQVSGGGQLSSGEASLPGTLHPVSF